MTLERYLEDLKGKRIAVVGVGVSNLPLLRLLASRGFDVTACDKNTAEGLGDAYKELSTMGVKFILGSHYIDKLDYDVVFRTPGLHPDKLKGAVRPDTVVTSEMDAFFAVCPCRIIAITGSAGAPHQPVSPASLSAPQRRGQSIHFISGL